MKIIRPDDWHCHFRDDVFLSRTVQDAAKTFGRVVAMPNLNPPIPCVAAALAYRERLLHFVPKGSAFSPLMTLYLTEQTAPEELVRAVNSEVILGCKLYPKGATTHSEFGVQNMAALYPIFEKMQELDLPLMVHGESIQSEVDIFDKEKHFLEETLQNVTRQFPALRIVLEHISTQAAVDFILESSQYVAATITAHHLVLNRNDLLVGGIKPHYYCLPIVKRQSDQAALIQAATSGNPKFFLGTDSAPHTQNKKESAVGCAGLYTSPIALSIYAQVFEEAHALAELEKFTSKNGPAFYGLAENKESIILIDKPYRVPETLSFGSEKLVPFCAGKTLKWQWTLTSSL